METESLKRCPVCGGLCEEVTRALMERLAERGEETRALRARIAELEESLREINREVDKIK